MGRAEQELSVKGRKEKGELGWGGVKGEKRECWEWRSVAGCEA